jgi:hypothetical protein
MEKDWYVISDFESFVNSVREIVYTHFSETDETYADEMMNNMLPEEISELEKVLSYSECETIVKDIAKKQTHKKNKKSRYLLNEKLFQSVVENINSRLISNLVSSLVNKGLLEMSFDEKKNDFVFWAKEDENKNS